MKKILLLSLFCFVVQLSTAQDMTTINLDGKQSMCISGKGPGQDGAINPYINKDSIALIKNTGENELSVRIQFIEKITETISVTPGLKKYIDLPKGHVLYFDTELPTTVKVGFKQKL